MDHLLRTTVLVIAGCGLVAGVTAAPAQAAKQAQSSYVVAESGKPRPRGNARKTGNYWSKGRSINSGNFSNMIDSYRSNNSLRGSANTVNGPQRLIVKSGGRK
ncbi:hypothetical protein FE391_13110 [Nonomuraea sp. KC401]|uniref:hypothetical protein n=1 Tax=unclassified Nonomuraea TaxID=2593643 RepID=UPI0010FDEC6A|nr:MULTISPECIES: hypothetical protein [unclassified Nonomuraea]NBE91892.1 hypothetical protein [Nonomuraea sp. K271]TLF75532.1 hypothetical protein FE391_13110 [Nonomuraea sp. KC401]